MTVRRQTKLSDTFVEFFCTVKGVLYKKKTQSFSKHILKFHFQLYSRKASCNAFYTSKVLPIQIVMKANYDSIIKSIAYKKNWCSKRTFAIKEAAREPLQWIPNKTTPANNRPTLGFLWWSRRITISEDLVPFDHSPPLFLWKIWYPKLEK